MRWKMLVSQCLHPAILHYFRSGNFQRQNIFVVCPSSDENQTCEIWTHIDLINVHYLCA